VANLLVALYCCAQSKSSGPTGTEDRQSLLLTTGNPVWSAPSLTTSRPNILEFGLGESLNHKRRDEGSSKRSAGAGEIARSPGPRSGRIPLETVQAGLPFRVDLIALRDQQFDLLLGLGDRPVGFGLDLFLRFSERRNGVLDR
jgi:hypothetical protein